jgi:aminoglycoside phosphotransferase family enzyme
MREKADEQLFLFYKMHRANVRIKVHAIGISGAGLSESAIQAELKQLQSYLQLFRQYFDKLDNL